MASHADPHVEDDALDPVGSTEDEGFEEGGYDEDLGDEAPEATEDANDALELQPEPQPEDEHEAFDAERASEAFSNGIVRALDAGSTEEFLARILGAIAQAARASATGSAEVLRALASALGGKPQESSAPESARRLFGAIAQWIAEGLDDLEAFDAAAALFADEAMDEALVPLAALGARILASDLSGGTRAPLGRSTGRALLHAVAAAVRTLASGGERRHVRALPRLARSVARVIRRSGLAAPQAARRLEHSLTEAARRIAASPELAIRLAAPVDPSRAPRIDAAPQPQPRRFTFTGPVTLTISAR